MKLVYAPEPLDVWDWNSVFLAGPTPRTPDVPSWRPQALEFLEKHGFDGYVYLPEPRDGIFSSSYDDNAAWEHQGLNFAGATLFWVPRDIVNGMPAFTTNVEFGWMVRSAHESGTASRIWYGRPDEAEKCKYLDWLYTEYLEKTPSSDLESLIIDVVGVLHGS